ncbi:arylsulfatase B-like [Trichogramma pretiosum]|uniref:arylsulfatase B-like n=1 Tax=Trichogramma pretiosum TaxID=7493 RepID=UPI000C71B651|nr:arylsulfatase B-like [Trichogramma pretiosum]
MDLLNYFYSFVAWVLSLGGLIEIPPPTLPTTTTTTTSPTSQVDNGTRPNIIVIMADDVGWNDFGFHGSNEIPTPNIDALAYSGVILNRHYSLPTCTPSRASFLTGRHAVRMGLQGLPPNVAEPRGVSLRERLLPEYLKELGYVTRLLGKWHLGYYSDAHLPTSRGYDSFEGYYGGYIRYFDHTVTKNKHRGIDYHRDEAPDEIRPYKDDRYVTDFIATRAEEIIRAHPAEQPLYLQLSHLAAHASEGAEPIEVRNLTEVDAEFGHVPEPNRRRYAGVIAALDESVGRVVAALAEARLLENSLIVLLSDNGAPTAIAPFKNHGSNYPLRGQKATVWEGGVRVPALVYSPLIKKSSRVSQDLFHMTDWFPTLLSAASAGDVAARDSLQLDGIDQWPTLSGSSNDDDEDGSETKRREALLVNIDEVIGPEAVIVQQYKLIRNVRRYKDYYGIDGNVYSPKEYDVEGVLKSPAALGIRTLAANDQLPKDGKIIQQLRTKARIADCRPKTSNYTDCEDHCLFDVIRDPCETTDLSKKYPEKVTILDAYMRDWRAVLSNQTNTYIDPAGYPENFDGYWMPWLDREYEPPAERNASIWSPEVFCEGFPIDDPRNCL